MHTIESIAQESAVTRISAEIGVPLTQAEAERLPQYAEYYAFALAHYAGR